MNDAVLPALVGFPLAAAGVTAMARTGARWVLPVLVLSLAAQVGVAAALLVDTHDGSVLGHNVGGWVPGVAIPFVGDQLSSLLVLVTGVLVLLSVWFAIATGPGRQPLFAPLVLVVTAGVNGALLTADVFNLFVFIEVMLVPSYGLLVIARRRRGTVESVHGSRVYVTFNLFVSSLFLTGVALVYGTAGTVNLAELAGRAQESTAVAAACAICLAALGMKAAVFPAHGWLAQAYPTTSPAVTALFSALHTKVAVYAIYRIYSVVFDGDERYLWIGLVTFAATMIVGVLAAVGETSMRSILVLNMVSGIGVVLIGVAVSTTASLSAGLFYLVHHMIVLSSLLMTAGAIEVRAGTSRIDQLAGVGRRQPWLAATFGVAALSLAGLPPFSGFAGKVAVVVATVDAERMVVAGIVIAVSLLTMLSMLRIWDQVFVSGAESPDQDGPAPDGGVLTAPPRVRLATAGPAVALAVVSVLFGVGAEALFAVTDVAAANLVDTTSYVEAVLR